MAISKEWVKIVVELHSTVFNFETMSVVEPKPELGEGPLRIDLPVYSGW